MPYSSDPMRYPIEYTQALAHVLDTGETLLIPLSHAQSTFHQKMHYQAFLKATAKNSTDDRLRSLANAVSLSLHPDKEYPTHLSLAPRSNSPLAVAIRASLPAPSFFLSNETPSSPPSSPSSEFPAWFTPNLDPAGKP